MIDFNNDILEIVGDYVKKGNEHRIDKEDDSETTDFIMINLKQKKKLKNIK